MTIIRTVFALSLLVGSSFGIAQTRANAQKDELPTSFKWKSEYWPKGTRQWSQTAPDQWTEKYEDGTADRKFRILRQIKVGSCNGLLLKSPDGTFEVFIPGSGCSSKWLLYRNVGLYAPTPQWIGQAEIQDIQYAPAAGGGATPR